MKLKAMLNRSLDVFRLSPFVQKYFYRRHFVLNDQDRFHALPKDVAVHVHVYYPMLAAEICSYLENIPVSYSLYITTDTQEKAALIESSFERLSNALVMKIFITDNRGRDIAPLLIAVGPQLAAHELVLHIHTKRSPDFPRVAGWRRYLLTSLLGSSERVHAIFSRFMRDQTLGILFPSHFQQVRDFIYENNATNIAWIEKLLVLIGKDKKELKKLDRTFFPSGDMFWFRGKALLPILKLNLTYDDFEPELGQCDLTLAHAMERMFPYFASQMGYKTHSFLAEGYLSEHYNALPLCELKNMPFSQFIGRLTVLYENNDIWQHNADSDSYMDDLVERGGVVLRVFYFDHYWFVQWVAQDERVLFYTRSKSTLFETIAPIQRGQYC